MIDIQTQIELDELVETARSLPPLPQSTTRIVSILTNTKFSLDVLISAVSVDPVLTAHLFRLANSVARNSVQPVATLQEAIVRLGTGTVQAVALAVGCQPRRSINLRPFGLTGEQFWRHCLSSVAVAEELRSHHKADFGANLAAAALLHDIGKLILAEHITPDRSVKLSQFRRSHPGHCCLAAEQAILGIDHAAAGAIVCREWKLPRSIVDAVANHHGECNWESDLRNGVIIANRMAHENDGHATTIDDSERVADAVLALGLDDSMFQTIANAGRRRLDALLSLFA